MPSWVLAIDLGGTNIRAGRVDPAGRVQGQTRCPTPPLLSEKDIPSLLEFFLHHLSIVPSDLIGIGLGIPGAVDQARGIVTQSPNFPHWKDFPIRSILENALPPQKTIVVENDANAQAVGEQWQGAGQGAAYLVVLTLGTGVGGGIILNHQLIRGMDGMAGEVGHITVEPLGFPCACGNQGCLEQYASQVGLSTMVQLIQNQIDPAKMDGQSGELLAPCLPTLRLQPHHQRLKNLSLDSHLPQVLQRWAEQKDPAALDLFSQMGRYLGMASATLVNLFNLERIIIGGGMSPAWEFFIHPLIQEMRRRSFRVPGERVQVVRSRLGDDAGLAGLAQLIFDNVR